MIRSFGSKDTERLWHRERVPSIDPRIQRVALRKLRQIASVQSVDELRVPPGNRLEVLKGDRAGQHSIRVNDQWRICFVWTDAGPDEAEIVDSLRALKALKASIGSSRFTRAKSSGGRHQGVRHHAAQGRRRHSGSRRAASMRSFTGAGASRRIPLCGPAGMSAQRRSSGLILA